MKTYTSEDFKKWGSKGGKATLKKHGKDHFKKMHENSIKVQSSIIPSLALKPSQNAKSSL